MIFIDFTLDIESHNGSKERKRSTTLYANALLTYNLKIPIGGRKKSDFEKKFEKNQFF